MHISDNKTGLRADSVFTLAERENNSRRRNLFVNYKQAKHIPAVPSDALRLFGMLGEQAEKYLRGKKCLVIGFAETATAIGAELAGCIGGSCVYVHTTREKMPDEYLVSDFSEEHSHATEQRLFSSEKDKLFDCAEAVVFVDDELTTGKTIINFMNSLKSVVSGSCGFYAASLINGISGENLKAFENMGITPFWLIRVSYTLEDLNKRLDITPLRDVLPSDTAAEFDMLELGGRKDPRLGCGARDYESACDELSERIYRSIKDRLEGCVDIDVIGTEECMYPAVKFGRYLEELGYNVRSHSTTRSPIVPSDTDGYPLRERCRLRSFYDRERTTYIYSLYPCDMTVLITDADAPDAETFREFASVLRSEKNIFVHWRE